MQKACTIGEPVGKPDVPSGTLDPEEYDDEEGDLTHANEIFILCILIVL